MAKKSENIAALCDSIISDARKGIFKPVYLLMGEESYYPDLVCSAIIEHCIAPEDKDFNETVCYGADVDTNQVISLCSSFPMMADRVLVVVKEAQALSKIENLAPYMDDPLESTVLVLLMHGGKLDKRGSLYKKIEKVGCVVDSPAVRDYQIPAWIVSYYSSRGLRISPAAAALLGEHAGTDLKRIVSETEKLLRNLPEGCREVKEEDIERNVGISREYSIFELSKLLSDHNAPRALRTAHGIAGAARFAMPAATAMLFTHFNRILRYGLLFQGGSRPTPEQKARALQGVNPYFYSEYDSALRHYPPRKCMEIISLISEYDYRSKGGSQAPAYELFMELVSKILSV